MADAHEGQSLLRSSEAEESSSESPRPQLVPRASMETFEVYSITERPRAMTGDKFTPFTSEHRKRSSRKLIQRTGSRKDRVKADLDEEKALQRDDYIPETRPRDASADFFDGLHENDFEVHTDGYFYRAKVQERIRSVLDSYIFRFLLVLATLFALFAKDCVEYKQGGELEYWIIDVGTCTVLAFFVLEMIASSFAVEGYFGSFYFFLDLAGTISLLPDISFIWPEQYSVTGLTIARASRAVRVGARVTRVLRFLRILRLMRILLTEARLARQRARKQQEGRGGGGRRGKVGVGGGGGGSAQNRLGEEHAELVGRRVVVGVILMLLVLPLLEYCDPSNAKANGLQSLQLQYSLATNSSMGMGVAQARLVVAAAAELFREQHASELVLLQVGNASTLPEVYYNYSRLDSVGYAPNVVDYSDSSSIFLPASITLYEPFGPELGAGTAGAAGAGTAVGSAWPAVQARFDISPTISAIALRNLLLTAFIILLFAVGAYVLNRDSQLLLVDPIEHLSNMTRTLASSLFAVGGAIDTYADSHATGGGHGDGKGGDGGGGDGDGGEAVTDNPAYQMEQGGGQAGQAQEQSERRRRHMHRASHMAVDEGAGEAAYIEGALHKISRFFDVSKTGHKETTIYTAGGDVWKVSVRREEERIMRGKGTTHRITSGDLHNMKHGQKKDLVRKLIFRDFLSDPQAIRYFRHFLERRVERSASGGRTLTSSPSSPPGSSRDMGHGGDGPDTNLRLWEEVEHFRIAMQECQQMARKIFARFGDCATFVSVLDESDAGRDPMRTSPRIVMAREVEEGPGEHTFKSVQDRALSILRTVDFPRFLDSYTFQYLEAAKKGLPMAIIVERDVERLDDDAMAGMRGDKLDSEGREQLAAAGGEEQPRTRLRAATRLFR